MELVDPSAKYKTSFLEAVKEFQASADTNSRVQRYRHINVSETDADFGVFVEKILAHARGEDLPQGYVPESEYWLVDQGVFLGCASLRHELNEILLSIGGHIGYEIRPSERGKGYGNKILELTLLKARERGISRVLITCDVTNIPSRKVIEKNGGVLENTVPNPETGIDKHRFWIDLIH